MNARATLNTSFFVIASAAKQSRMPAESTNSGSPRHFVPRDDGINQRFPRLIQQGIPPYSRSVQSGFRVDVIGASPRAVAHPAGPARLVVGLMPARYFLKRLQNFRLQTSLK